MTAIPTSPRIGSLWQQRVQNMREYEVIRDGNVFNTSFSPSYVISSEYDRARQMLDALLSRYEGMSFDAVFAGSEIANDGGTCFVQKSRHEVSCGPVDASLFREVVMSDLTLVHGIGPALQRRLKQRGYTTISHLCSHPRYRTSAEGAIQCLSHGSSLEIMDFIGNRHSKSHNSILGTAVMHEPEDFVFFDIETLGLFSRPIILFGIGLLDHGRLEVSQYLLRDIKEEEAALLATVEHLSRDHPALVTFNGKSFDLPYLADRLAYYGHGAPTRVPHYDVLHFSRRRWKGVLPSLRLTAIEKEILDTRRQDDVPGQMVPEFYAAYQRSGNPGPLVPVMEHNCQDVVSLARLFFRLLGESYGCS